MHPSLNPIMSMDMSMSCLERDLMPMSRPRSKSKSSSKGDPMPEFQLKDLPEIMHENMPEFHNDPEDEYWYVDEFQCNKEAEFLCGFLPECQIEVKTETKSVHVPATVPARVYKEDIFFHSCDVSMFLSLYKRCSSCR